MKVLPYKKIIIRHNKSKDETSEIINSVTEPCKVFGNRYSSKIFCGECDNDSFKIKRIIQYRNSFLPIIKGEIHDNELVIAIRMHHIINIVMTIWMIGATLGFLASLVCLIHSLFSGHFSFYCIIGLIPLPVGFFLLRFGFWQEVEKAENALKKLISS